MVLRGLLKKDSEFVWDTIANNSFEALKLSLTQAPLLFPPDYSRDYFLYLAASEYTIGMVLVQEDDAHDEHVVYYLSRSLTPTEIKYQHVEKLALATSFKLFNAFGTISSHENYGDFSLQPYATYFDTSIARGKILQMDCHTPGV
jgi:hypothetical protein